MATCVSDSFTAYLRVAAVSIALYDALWTIPAEISLYREQKSFKRMTRACILFILIRYTSVLVIVISNVGFFNHSFTQDSCRKFYLISPSFKALQAMVSQIIVAVRTIAVARQARWVVWVVGVLFMISVTLEFISNIWRRVPFRQPENATRANCTSGNDTGAKIAWVHYLAALIYDSTCGAIATGYIYAQSRGQPDHTLDGLSKMLLKEGLLYFFFLTGVNVLNLVLYMTSSEETQSAGATLGYATTWIMSQRLLIHLHQYRKTASSRSRSASNGPHRPAKTGFPNFLSRTIANNRTLTNVNTGDDVELGVHVTVEEAVKVDYDQDIDMDITGGLVSPHRITTARIEKEHRRREERRKRSRGERDREGDGDGDEEDEESFDGRGKVGKGWEVTSVGKIFSP